MGGSLEWSLRMWLIAAPLVGTVEKHMRFTLMWSLKKAYTLMHSTRILRRCSAPIA
jgi:hypothetical protein